MKKLVILLTCLSIILLSSCNDKTVSDNETTVDSVSTSEAETTDETEENSITETTGQIEESTNETKTEIETTVKETTTKALKKTTTTTKKTTTKTENNNSVEPTYIKGILVVNKTYSLPESYAPGVNETALNAYYEMKADAKAEGLSFTIISDYRPYSSQKRIYNNYVAQDGKAEADRYSARPGHSEHQTGLAFDINSLSQSFENTNEGKWLAANCYKYGFIIRYPKGKESITGYMYEPWHIRYLGKETAKKVYESGLTLEEYLGITSRYSD